MKAILYTLIIFTVFVLTNPDRASHLAKVKERVMEKVNVQKAATDNVFDETNMGQIVDAMGASIADNMVSKSIKVDNLFAFSLTRLHTETENTVIGLGILGRVYLFDNF